MHIFDFEYRIRFKKKSIVSYHPVLLSIHGHKHYFAIKILNTTTIF